MLQVICVALFLAGAVAQAAESLAGVSISNIRTDLPNMQVSFTITNTTDKTLTAFAVQIVSIYDTTRNVSVLDSEATAHPDAWITPGGHRDYTLPLSKVPVKNDQESYDNFDPTSGDVIFAAVAFDDDRAFGSAEDIKVFEQDRDFELRISSERLQILQAAKQAADRRAFVANVIATTPKPGERRVEKTVEAMQAWNRLEWLRIFLEQLNTAVTSTTPAQATDWLDAQLAIDAKVKASLEGHTKLIRVQ